MTFQTRLLVETFIADFALEVLLSRVNHHVVPQLKALYETSLAHVTLERLRSGVNQHVVAQLRHL